MRQPLVVAIIAWALVGGTMPRLVLGQAPGQPLSVTLVPVEAAGPPATPLLAADPTLPGIFPCNLSVDIGFEYLRPEFPSRSIALAVPAGVSGSFSILGRTGNVIHDFAFVPKISVDYQFQDLGFGVGASGKLTSLSGHLLRTVDSAAGSANLTAESSVDLAVVNFLEATKFLPLDRFPCCQDTCLQDTVLFATIGMRYSHVRQDFTASLASGANISTVKAHQDYDGFGLTTSLSILHPLPSNFFLYGTSRGSFLIGTNNRDSSYSVVATSIPGASTSAKVTENKTKFIPVGEFEFGLAWGKPLSPRRVQAQAAAGQVGAVLWLKGGMVFDVWGGLELLAPSDTFHPFTDGSLFLYGFTILGGIDF
jgi:hypothetical protein